VAELALKISNNNMNPQEEQEYQERMGSPEMEYLQYLTDFPDMRDELATPKTDKQTEV
jgi:hypothetical protein